MFSLSLIASSNVVIPKFLQNSRSALQPAEVRRHALSMRFFCPIFLELYDYRKPDRLEKI